MKVYSYMTLLNEAGNPYLEKGNSYDIDGRRTYNTPQDISEFVYKGLELHKYADEYVWIICFDNRYHIIGCFQASHGSVSSSICSNREIFQKALLIGAVNIVMVHNHPSNDCSPSSEDITVAKKIKEAGELIGVYVVDSMIVSRFGWISMVEYGF